ncbi:hypothetical protein EYZ11_002400 [Aspergillus tanneri]|uniref:Uncharacterized protein n=1 Tax=Aspergillus tanneri TaxID=1220188 RepID=A0A4S3JQZ1_9EURO|nr:hypothetical protein EYZ11_002400 [Aspergillus tanneri]
MNLSSRAECLPSWQASEKAKMKDMSNGNVGPSWYNGRRQISPSAISSSLLYQLNGGISHPFIEGDHLPTMVESSPAGFPDTTTFTIDDFMMCSFVETADFQTMTMSRSGHVLFGNSMMFH